MTAPPRAPDISVCIVNWNGAALLPRLFDSLERERGERALEVIVVDNASSDGSPELIAAQHPEVRLIRNRDNVGFARANDQAAAVAHAPLLFFLNNDMELTPATLPPLLDYLSEHPNVVAVGPRLRWPDGRIQESSGGLPDLVGLLHRIRWLRWTGAFRARYRGYRHSHSEGTGPRPRLAGAALLVRASALPAPLWDPAFPFGLEDVDLCVRLAEVGGVHYVAEAEAIHHGSVSSDANPAFVLAGYEHGYARFLAKHDARAWAAPLYRLLVTLDLPARLLLLFLRGIALLVRGHTDKAQRTWAQLRANARFAFLGLPTYWGPLAGPVLVCSGLALFLRLLSGMRSGVIARDGIGYLQAAARFLGRDWTGGLTHHYPPGYPSVLALSGAVAGRLDEGVATVASALVASSLVPAIGILTARAHGRVAGIYAALLTAILPLWVELGGQVLSEALYLPLLAWSLVLLQHVQRGARGARWAGLGAGFLFVWAYLTRPEGLVAMAAGLVALLALPRPHPAATLRRRVTDTLWLLAPVLLAGVPFLLFIMGRDTLAGTGSGSFKLTLKQDMGDLLSKASPAQFLGNAGDILRLWAKGLGPGALLLVLPFALRERRPVLTAAGRALLGMSLLVGLALLVTFGLVRSERRYAAQLLVLAIPHAGLGAALAARWLSRRRAHGPTLLAVVLTLSCLPFALTTVRRRKATYRDAGAFLADQGCRRILSRDSRAAYYAGAESRALLLYFPQGVPRGGREVLDVARAEGIDGVVLVVEEENGRRVSHQLSELLGPPRAIRRAGLLPLDVFTLKPAGDR